MTRTEARAVIYKVVNSGILDIDLEGDLTEVANHICDDGWENCTVQTYQFECVECKHSDIGGDDD